MSITAHSSVEAFFHEVLTEAFDSREVQASEHTEYYLVGLLGEFTTARLPDEPLALTLVRSRKVERHERFRLLKQVADTTLWVTGLFADSFDRKLFDPEYYIGLGEAAYSELAAASTASRNVAAVYAEIAAKFPRFVDVLNEVRSRVNFSGNDVVALYGEWQRTRSEWVEKRLRRMGLIVPGDDGSLH
jgi:hypothetical protein